MGKRPKYSRDQILEASLRLLREEGPRAVTMSSIARTLEAPSGSLYHRFSGRDELLAELWLETVERFQSGLRTLETIDDVVLYVLDWSQRNPARAQLLTLYRSNDLLDGPWPDSVSHQAHRLRSELEHFFEDFSDRLQVEQQRLIFALVEIPLAGLRRFLVEGHPLPSSYKTYVLQAARAVVQGGFLAEES